MKSAITRSTFEVSKKFLNARYRLFQAFPNLILVSLMLIFGLILALRPQGYRTTVLLGAVVALVCVGFYEKTKSYPEAVISFFIGILTVFSIKWNVVNSLIFVGLFLAFNLMLFWSSSIETTTKYVMLLIQAAAFIDPKDEDRIASVLKTIADLPTKNDQLDIMEKAVALRFFAFRKIPIEQMSDALNSLESIKSIAILPIEDACMGVPPKSVPVKMLGSPQKKGDPIAKNKVHGDPDSRGVARSRGTRCDRCQCVQTSRRIGEHPLPMETPLRRHVRLGGKAAKGA